MGGRARLFLESKVGTNCGEMGRVGLKAPLPVEKRYNLKVSRSFEFPVSPSFSPTHFKNHGLRGPFAPGTIRDNSFPNENNHIASHVANFRDRSERHFCEPGVAAVAIEENLYVTQPLQTYFCARNLLDVIPNINYAAPWPTCSLRKLSPLAVPFRYFPPSIHTAQQGFFSFLFSRRW